MLRGTSARFSCKAHPRPCCYFFLGRIDGLITERVVQYCFRNKDLWQSCQEKILPAHALVGVSRWLINVHISWTLLVGAFASAVANGISVNCNGGELSSARSTQRIRDDREDLLIVQHYIHPPTQTNKQTGLISSIAWSTSSLAVCRNIK